MIRRIARIAGVALVCVAVVVAGIAIDYRNWHQTQLHQDESPKTVEIDSGSSVRSLQRQLENDVGMERPLYFRLYSRLSGKAQRLQSGEYGLPAGMTAPQLLHRIASGDVIQYRFTVVEGWTFRQLLAAMQADPRILDTLDAPDDTEVMAAVGSPDKEHPEGWFLPETYNYTRGTTDLDLLRRAHRAMQRELSSVWDNRVDGLPLDSAYEALILASIIERETGAPEERGEIAGVFVRRLEDGMRLQTDPTVIYGMGDAYDGRIRTRDLRTDTPYNTYTRHGLPPTPIAMPGRASLQASVNPEPGTSMYFVSRGDGTHVFSETLEEHNSAVRRYILGQGGDD
ncbi:endolytic transglycosylase MltG [Aquisalimonas sp.]|uniref:endolytic transglycosylase MltG n=1 Tax=unclassified Aquisalimonas TaxID=2644645 RepID=UPI0025C30A7F|nr:endolytic transglycosylase MltG [Aquisalimonas sp.]